MAEKIQFGDLNEDAIKEQLDTLTGAASKNSAPALTAFANFQKQRAARLESAAKILKKELGAEHPDYLIVKRNAETAAVLNVQLKTQSTRIANRPKPKPNEWVVYGQVLDARGKPASRLRVRVFDRDRKFDDLLGDTETDANGDFSVIFHERDFMEVGEKLPELYVMVSDVDGNTLYTSRDDVRFRAGRMEYFLIQLGKAPPTRATSKTSTKG